LELDLWNEQADLLDDALSLVLSDDSPGQRGSQSIFYTKESGASLMWPYLRVTYEPSPVPEPAIIFCRSNIFIR